MVEDRWSRLSEPSSCQTSRSKKSLNLSYKLHVGGAKKFYSWAQTFTPFHLQFPCRDDSCQWFEDMDLSTNLEPLKDMLKISKILTILHGLHEIGVQLMQSNILNRQLSLSGSGISRFFAPPDLFLELLSYLFAFWKLLGILQDSCSYHIAWVK